MCSDNFYCGSDAVLNLLQRCTRRIRLSWRCVIMRGRPLLGRSVNLPVALRRWTKRDIVDSCTPNCCATSRCDRPCKNRAIALPLSSCAKRTISLNKLKQQNFCATDTNGTKVRFGNVLKSLPRDTTRAARVQRNSGTTILCSLCSRFCDFVWSIHGEVH